MTNTTSQKTFGWNLDDTTVQAERIDSAARLLADDYADCINNDSEIGGRHLHVWQMQQTQARSGFRAFFARPSRGGQSPQFVKEFTVHEVSAA